MRGEKKEDGLAIGSTTRPLAKVIEALRTLYFIKGKSKDFSSSRGSFIYKRGQLLWLLLFFQGRLWLARYDSKKGTSASL